MKNWLLGVLVFSQLVSVSCSRSEEQPYTVVLDGSPFEQIVKNHNYAWNAEIYSGHFPSECKTGEQVTVELISIYVSPQAITEDYEAPYKRALTALDKLNVRPAKLCELAAFAIRYPTVVRKEQGGIFALGSTWFWSAEGKTIYRGFSKEPIAPDYLELRYPSVACLLPVTCEFNFALLGGRNTLAVVRKEQL